MHYSSYSPLLTSNYMLYGGGEPLMLITANNSLLTASFCFSLPTLMRSWTNDAINIMSNLMSSFSTISCKQNEQNEVTVTRHQMKHLVHGNIYQTKSFPINMEQTVQHKILMKIVNTLQIVPEVAYGLLPMTRKVANTTGIDRHANLCHPMPNCPSNVLSPRCFPHNGCFSLGVRHNHMDQGQEDKRGAVTLPSFNTREQFSQCLLNRL